ncbi:MAG TPA: HEAT repeat domain-containing protein [Bryobacteraceae bacterium]|nr:HEAT repeat domain-containing protein [Bryobacteraceae bacterium]
MNCEEARKSFPLLLYGELSFDEEERLEAHIDECAACREALARDKALWRELDSAELHPTQDLLEDARAELKSRLAAARPMRESFWDKIRDGFSIHFHFAPGLGQVAGAAVMLALGFFAARVTPGSLGGAFHAAGLAEPVTSRVRYIEPDGPGKVQIVLDETRQQVLSGSVEDPSIQRLLLAAAKDPSDAGVRVESVDLLKNEPQSAEVRQALLYALQHDPNAGVRLKALDGLKAFAEDPETRRTLTHVLLNDDNPGVRTQVIDLLIQQHDSLRQRNDAMVSVLQELMEKESNNYIRMRCQKALTEMNASVESY